MALLGMGDSAAEAQKELCLDLVGEMNGILNELPAVGGTAVPSAAQVPCVSQDCHMPLQLHSGHCTWPALGNSLRGRLSLVHTAYVLLPSAEVTGALAHQAAAFGRLAGLVYWAAAMAAKGRCAVLLGQLWGEWAAMLAVALLVAMHWARLQPAHVAERRSGSAAHSDGGTPNEGSQQQLLQQQQQPWEQRRLGKAVFELAFAARQLLPPAGTASLGTLQREQVPRLMMSLGKYCAIDSASIHRYVQVRHPEQNGGTGYCLITYPATHRHIVCLSFVCCALRVPAQCSVPAQCTCSN